MFFRKKKDKIVQEESQAFLEGVESNEESGLSEEGSSEGEDLDGVSEEELSQDGEKEDLSDEDTGYEEGDDEGGEEDEYDELEEGDDEEYEDEYDEYGEEEYVEKKAGFFKRLLIRMGLVRKTADFEDLDEEGAAGFDDEEYDGYEDGEYDDEEYEDGEYEDEEYEDGEQEYGDAEALEDEYDPDLGEMEETDDEYDPKEYDEEEYDPEEYDEEEYDEEDARPAKKRFAFLKKLAFFKKLGIVKKFSKLSRKKKAIICAVAALVAAAGIYLVLFGFPGGGSGNKIYVQQVSEIMGLGSGNGTLNRYAGVVESQETWNIKQNADKTVKEIYVKEGDSVKVGDKLFAYDNDEAKLNLEQAKLELERMQSEIKSGQAEISNLEKEKRNARGSEQLEYTIQIQSQRATNKKTEYEIKSQQAKIKSLEKATKNSVVKSEMAGVVKKINQAAAGNGASSDDMDDGSDESIFMSILATGDYRVKAMINEQNKFTIEEGTAVIVRSRVDDSTWKGTISKLDVDNPEQNSSNDYMDSGDSDNTTTSSKYPFYVKLDSSDGLVLGQHVYLEPDYGQDEAKEGLWLDSYYIVQEDKASYVWAESMTKRLEKRKVTLGEYNEELSQYQITDGLKEDDYIAFPEEGLTEGLKTTRNVNEAAEGNTGIEPEDSTGDILPEDEMGDETDGQLLDEPEAGGNADDGALTDDGSSGGDDGIWTDEPENEDGSVGFLYDRAEVLA